MTSITLDPGGRPKRYVIDRAFGHLGSAGYQFQHTPEEIADALENLDMLMSEDPWNLLGYALPPYGSGSPEDSSGLPDNALFAASVELASRLAAAWGATIPPLTLAQGDRAKGQLFGAYVTPPTLVTPPGVSLGMGSRRWRLNPFSVPEC